MISDLNLSLDDLVSIADLDDLEEYSSFSGQNIEDDQDFYFAGEGKVLS